MKSKIIAIQSVTLFILSLTVLVSAQTDNTIWQDDMSYASVAQMQAAGWTVTHEDGVSFSGTAIVLDGTSQDTAIHYSQHFASGISDWKVEDKSRWTMGSHCGNLVTAVTDKHSYSFMADGWYGNYVFYRDGQKTTFGSFQENKNTWFTLAIEKQGNQINMYYNGEIKSTYTETDTSASQLVGVDAVSPWKGGSEYDYFEVWQIGDTSTQETQQSLLSNPIVIGGIIGGVCIGVGATVYYIFIAGGSSTAASAGTGSGGAGSAGGTGSGSGSDGGSSGGSGNTGGGTLIHNHPAPQSELAAENVPNLTNTAAPSQPAPTQQQSDPQSILTQIQTDMQHNQIERLKIQSDLHTQTIEVPQDVTVNKAKTQDKAFQSMDQYLRSQNDPDAVADSGSGSGGSES